MRPPASAERRYLDNQRWLRQDVSNVREVAPQIALGVGGSFRQLLIANAVG